MPTPNDIAHFPRRTWPVGSLPTNYVIARDGDTPMSLAARAHVPTAHLLALNALKFANKPLKHGKRIRIA